jgi:hypothetical protein
MLHSLSLHKYPSSTAGISDNNELKGLTYVNYLVGENGAGKEDILKLIHKKCGKQVLEFGFQETFDLFYSQNWKNLQIGIETKILLIQCPENDLYPSWHLKIPTLLDKLAMHYRLQIFVITNSPFVIASVGELSEEQKVMCHCSKDDYLPRHKVYVLRNGLVASKRGEISLDIDNRPKGRYGYWGKKSNFIASQMLSNGLLSNSRLDDFTVSSDAPIVILCEGSKDEADAIIYNTIFETYNKQAALFVSCQGTHQLTTSFDVFRQIKNSLSADFNLYMLRDRDHEFADLNAIKEYERSYPKRRVLHKRAIECYLYNSETADLLLKTIGKELTNNNREKMDLLQAKIQHEAETGYTGHEYKDALKEMFASITMEYNHTLEQKLIANPDFRLSTDVIAKLITKETQTYKDLAISIFE